MEKDHSIEIGFFKTEMKKQLGYFRTEMENQVECRICQEKEEKFNLEAPCACSGTVKYAHRKCVQQWCDKKGNTVCEICLQPYQSGYTASSGFDESERVASIHLRNQWVAGEELQEFEERRFWGLDEEDFSEINSVTAGSCRSAAIILFLLRAAGILLPCFIMARAMSIFHQRKKRQDEAMTVAAGTSNTRRGQARGASSPSLPEP